MTLIVCLDNCNGMAFNGRRQSMDAKLRSRMLMQTQMVRLWMSPYSAKQFEALPAYVHTADDFLQEAKAGEACFVELQDVADSLQHCNKLIIYRWNRQYPADLYFPIDILMDRFALIGQEDFAGSSHERITEEVYEVK